MVVRAGRRRRPLVLRRHRLAIRRPDGGARGGVPGGDDSRLSGAAEAGRCPPPGPREAAAKHPEAALDLNPVTIKITNLDYNGLLNNSPTVINSVRNAIRGNAGVRSRQAGLVLLFDGANSQDPSDQALAIDVDRKVQRILRSLGAQNILFQVAVYRNFLDLTEPPSNFHMDVYLFKTS